MSNQKSEHYDVLTIGRSGVDIYPLQIGKGLEDVTSFGKFLGGSPTNVAVAAARHGHSAAAVTAVGKDPFGRFVRNEMRALGVSDEFVQVNDTLATPVTFCEIFPPDDFPLYFYREPAAPDLKLDQDQIDLSAVRDAKVFWISGTGLSEDPSRSVHFQALKARRDLGAGQHTVFDLDYRPMFWETIEQARTYFQLALTDCTVAVGNREECEVAVDETDPHRAADALLDLGVELAIVKQGPKGVLGKTKHESVEVPPNVIDVVNGLGAGDSFGGSLCDGLVRDLGVEEILTRSNAAGAIVSTRLECSTAMPTPEEIDTMIAGGDVNQGKDAAGMLADVRRKVGLDA
ncbi:5-dehydro-2-deoxygluconokinase [Helcobacillus massiliensis]|uniref:5-dehydro-2-deoxygluconokinase n=1 Tax=Helcobacillus massiliensis TaxID=521392 RepID=A0A839QV08_9MICO|nr:5-dehydro-2-deoxygluconokinase [Helcobacillus massiliensis]MBB3023565.1 5-dehydro-2-deoxygluconokinase [Helcobacillus massiliensis]MCT1557570.1 5-dehydro-2-deoxygluconokinase [Helcobacillus massiliensis]MCT2036795.1 5-dehydro-2-deoxygluconokinase [Helcobacillus massiliensis]MCT2332452.1 5-dehydro-2-deoxygluconokinase [Helcobacillus massiliensis]